jgi:hypothetical protein
MRVTGLVVGSTVAFIGIILILLGAFVGSPKLTPVPEHERMDPHVFANPEFPLTRITVTVLYFVPRDKTAVPREQWMPPLEQAFASLRDFHAVQLRGQSDISVIMHENPVYGAYTHEFYDVGAANHNESQALEPIVQELAEQHADILLRSPGTGYPVVVILYEGAGAGGMAGYAVLSRTFFTRIETREFADTFLAHEFYHALGVPDGYRTVQKIFPDGATVNTELLTSRDVMSRVRVPLSETYLDYQTLAKMGF